MPNDRHYSRREGTVTLTKKELVERISDRTGLNLTDCSRVIDQLAAQVIESLNANDICPLPGIGKLVVKVREPRNGRNPRTGEIISLPRKRVVSLRPGKHIKDLINS